MPERVAVMRVAARDRRGRGRARTRPENQKGDMNEGASGRSERRVDRLRRALHQDVGFFSLTHETRQHDGCGPCGHCGHIGLQ
jgi:hypothetical protein